ncbi:hypothetical protein SAMN05216312_102396 [Cohnella sp. OV330]|uniref:hypothetical protein n=1 Tax=Cohnella sp. OV330 TaxID=1855288 RepID=UPI0008E0E80D|nr:hypothetical protein [Cohnella sp. OV330]SFA94095.1 hypothetical protein SAMN05216312_102396 [Cohnella sp. OV330]
MSRLPDEAIAILAGAIAALAWLSYRRSAKTRYNLLRELFERTAAVAGFEPEAVLVVQPQTGAEAAFAAQIHRAPRSWHVVLVGPAWLAAMKSAAWRRPVSGMDILPFGKGALKERAYLAIRRGRRFELVHELLPYMERLGSSWPEVGVESPSTAADAALDRLLQ